MMEALEAVAADRGIGVDVLLEALANGIEAAYKRRPGASPDAYVVIDENFDIRVIAQEIDEEGEIVREFDDTPDDMGRIAAQTVRQVMTQRIREVERDLKYEEYAGREGDIADALGHDLAHGLRRDAAHVVGRVVVLADDLALFVDLLGDDPDVEGLVDDDVGIGRGAGLALVRGLDAVGQRLEQHVDADAPVGGDGLEGLHHVGVAHDLGCLFLFGSVRPPFGGVGPHAKTVFALVMSRYATRRSASSMISTAASSSASRSMPRSRSAPSGVRIFRLTSLPSDQR